MKLCALRELRSLTNRALCTRVCHIAQPGLEDVVSSIVGDVENRGISGGQRKRVNIGMELVADPTFLA